MTVRIELFYDVVSPYSFLAFTVLERYRERWQLDLVLRPFFLAGVMKSVGNVPPASLPARAPYLIADLVRLARYVERPLTLPEDFPGNTLRAMRLVTAVQRLAPAHLASISRVLWEHHWGQGRPLDDASLRQSLAPAGLSGAEGEAVWAALDDPANKDALKATSDEAVARGCFGAPSMFVEQDGEQQLYFGSDRISLLAFELGLPWEGPVPGRARGR